MMARIPLIVIGGFLGAGKTTLVNHLLRTSAGRRWAVLVNDFGEINVDSALIAAQAGDTIALTNGCVCCSIGDDLTSALIGVLETSPSFDGIIVEASGVSDPARIASIALADPSLEPQGTIVLIDAAAVLQQASDPHLADVIGAQLASADFLVVNKIDSATDAQSRELHAWLDIAAPGVPRFETRSAAVPWKLLQPLELRAAGESIPSRVHRHEHGRGHGHGPVGHDFDFETWSLRLDAVFNAEKLRALLRAMPDGVLRLKGFVRTDAHGWSELQFAGRHGSLRCATFVPERGVAVAIGQRGRLPRASLEALFGTAELHPRSGGG
jgi:G3E family GTPase